MSSQTGYIVMCDIKGIQAYIFNSSKLKEIEGASILLEKVLVEGIEYCAKNLKVYNKDEPFSLFSDNNSEHIAEIVFIGGGNACIAFKECDAANTFIQCLSEYLLDTTGELTCVMAMTEIKDNFSNTWNCLLSQLHKNKFQAVFNQPMQAIAGYYSETAKNKKLTSFNNYHKTTNHANNTLKLEDLVTEHGDDSMIAIIHVDGNSMSDKINAIVAEIDNEHGINEALTVLQNLSNIINNIYQTAYEQLHQSMIVNLPKKGKLRSVIQSGDDISFVCNAHYALSVAEFLLEQIQGEININGQSITISACAGIAFINSHFPFSYGHETAVACCNNAKLKQRDYAKTGSKDTAWIDFQFCSDPETKHLSQYRKLSYKTVDQSKLLLRPYCIQDKNPSLSYLKDKIKVIDQLPRRWQKRLRDAYALGETAACALAVEINAKYNNALKDVYTELPLQNIQYAVYYDALDLKDHFEDVIDCLKANNRKETAND